MLTTLARNLFIPLRSHEIHSRLGISPNDLDVFSVTVMMCLYIARTIKHTLGLGTPFRPLKPQHDVSKPDDEPQEQLFALPDHSLYMPLKLNASDVDAFTKAIELGGTAKDDSEVNKAQLCLYLAALSEPAMLLMLAKRGCPILPLGAVNVRNRFEILDFGLCQALYRDSSGFAKTSQSSVLAKYPRPARRVRRGIELDVEVSIVVDSQLDGSGDKNNQTKSSVIFRQEFTILQFMKLKDKQVSAARTTAKPKTTKTDDASGKNNSSILEVKMDSEAPHLWAKVCKDYNPIHFSPILAKLLGQSGQLAHGNHAVGVCIQAMSRLVNGVSGPGIDDQAEEEQLSAVKQLVSNMTENTGEGSGEWWMEVGFRRPIVLPARIGTRPNSIGSGFEVVDQISGKPHVEVVMGVL